ncbi:Myo-inositol transporter 2 [Auxenochlorella protothecoides]|uniref:Myo-inositol transporter 2 n=1 Tax=Auxenochlorella protothecoides TaxID=3075 RepID=A0A087SQX9_AUXPR|nr:Myo-inositol transporter 2 [Auxenochlorella protothecoides]KFM28133.1 Myo-inositol transporter 2 [Auxenochlorella protothecoides]RMZ54233.1 hypothetical protein APUTEX25_000584 [Auxenochlorella protothecoides]|eukprot:RMZ54233.1 hypothetical protein APUTEX25_000584 [Auxenochlorella protothecoides]
MLLRVVLSASLGGFLFGYDLGLMGGAILAIREALGTGTATEELIMAGAKLGAVFGTFLGGAVMLHWGRRAALAADGVFFVVGPLAMALSPGVAGLVAGRVVVGLGIGMSAVAVPAYLGELAPAAHRGATVEVYELLLTVGALTAVVVDAGLHHVPHNWRWMVGAPLGPALALGGLQTSTAEVEAELMALWSAVEKERTEVTARRERHAAARETRAAPIAQVDVEAEAGSSPSHSKWLPLQGADPAEVDLGHTKLLQEGQESSSFVSPTEDLRCEQAALNPSTAIEVDEGSLVVDADGQPPGFLRVSADMFLDVWLLPRGPDRRAFHLALCLAFFNQAVASTAIINYAPSLLASAGLAPARATLASAAVSACKLVGVVVGLVLVDRAGRRRLLLTGSVLCTLSLAWLAVADAVGSVGLLLAGMCLFVLSHSASWAGVFWVLLSELFSMAAKSPATSAATATLFATGAASDALFLSLRDWLGPGAFAMYACIAAAGGVYVMAKVPETSGRTLEEIQALLAGGRRDLELTAGSG